jgi:sugar phosphate isomerase/epimerase
VRLSVSTACLDAGFWETLDLYAGAGLTDVELGTTTEPLGERVVERLRALGLSYLVHNYFPPPAKTFVLNLASPDAAIREDSVHLVEDALATAAALGSPLYSVHAGFVGDPPGQDRAGFAIPPGDPDAAKTRFRDGLERALARAAELGVELLVENNVCTPRNRDRLLLQTADEFDELPGFGILLDTGHLAVSAATLGFDPLEAVRKLAPRIRAFHLHDNDGSLDAHAPVAAGSWALEAVRLSDPAAVIVEARFGNVAELREHVDWLRAEL